MLMGFNSMFLLPECNHLSYVVVTGLVTTGTEDKVSEDSQSIQGTSTQIFKLHNRKNYRFSLKK